MLKPKETRQHENRLDVYESIPSSEFKEDSDGSLVGRATVTCVGVFPYRMADGSIFNELRLPEEVFASESLDSLRLIPVTNDHPSEMVTPDNVDKYQVGTTGEDVCRAELWGDVGGFLYKTDGTQVTIPMKITKRDAINAVKNGKHALSCGYSCDLELTPGVWGGVAYDAIQRNIRYNHVAIVDRGRAGDTAVINYKLDNAFVPTYVAGERSDAAGTKPTKEGVKDDSNKEATTMPKSLVIDSATFEVDEKVADAFAAKTKETETLKGQIVAKDAQIEALKAEMSGMIKADALAEKVKEYQAIKDTADKFGVSLEDGMSVSEMKKAIVKVAVPSLADSIEEKSEDFVNGVFSSCDALAPVQKPVSKKTEDNDDEADADEAHEDNSNHDSDDDSHADSYDKLNARLQKKFGNR